MAKLHVYHAYQGPSLLATKARTEGVGESNEMISNVGKSREGVEFMIFLWRDMSFSGMLIRKKIN